MNYNLKPKASKKLKVGSSSSLVNSVRALCIGKKFTGLTYQDLIVVKEKSYRNGNWQRLNPMERALYKASVGLARLRGGVVNASLLSELTIVIEKMLKTTKNVILLIGKKKAEQLKFLYRSSGVLVWMPQLEALLNDENYVLWLGNREMLVRGLGLYMPLA